MFRNIIKVAIRNLLRQKFYSLINVIGLAVGIAACLFIAIYVQVQVQFDKHHTKGENIYRINQTNIWVENGDNLTAIGPAVAPLLKEEFPEILETARVFQPGNFFITNQKANNQIISFEERKLAAIDTSFLTIFDFDWIAGSPTTALQKQNEVLLTKSMAEKYFGENIENAVGKFLHINNGNMSKNVVVGGIIADLPIYSHFQFDMFFSMSTFPVIKKLDWSWIFSRCVTYLLVNEEADIPKLEKALEFFPPKYAGESIERVLGYSYEEFEKKGKPWKMYIQPLHDIHLGSAGLTNPYPFAPNGDLQNLYVFTLAGGFIFLLACINFMNLATARAAGRAKEIGVRKTLGSTKQLLVFQFITEAILLSAIAVLLALGICEILRPTFNVIAGNIISKPIFQYAQLMAVLPIVALLTGIFAGSYPAFYLTRFKPVQVLKGKVAEIQGGDKSFRRVLVGLQFAVSAFMVICTAFVLSQVSYMRNRDLGYQKENLLTIRNLGLLAETEAEQISKKEALKNSILQLPGVKAASSSNYVMPHIYSQDYFSSDLRGERFSLNYLKADADFFKLTGIKLLKGNDFEAQSGALTKVIVNEATVRALGFANGEIEKAIGVNLSFPYPGATQYEIIGIMEDTQLSGLDNSIDPLAVFPYKSDIFNPSKSVFLTVRIKEGTDLSDLIEKLEFAWQAQGAQIPFQYFFVDDEFDTLFRTEKRLASVLGVFTFIAIMLAVLGLLGLVAFIASKKTKEIGIRKVLGASPFQILILLSKEFTWLVIAGFLLALPLSYFFISNWLQGFTYKTEITPNIFAMVLLAGLLLAWTVIALQAFKTLKMKAVDALKD